MAAPALSADTQIGSRARVRTFTQSGANDGTVSWESPKPLAGMSLQLTGTYAAGTIAILGSNNNSDFVALPTAISLTALGIKSVAAIDLAYRYYQISFTSMNSSNDLVARVVEKYSL